jgi:hypothetical protein
LTLTGLLLLTLSAALPAAGRPHNTPPDGFTNLFDGKTLTGWRGRQGTYSPYAEAALSPEEHAKKVADWADSMAKNWSVDAEKGEIVSNGLGVHLATDKDYGDIECWVDWLMIKENGDSGIYLRSVPQIQIWNPDNPREVKNGAQKGSGALWNNNADNPGKWPLVRADNPVGQWNTLHFKMVGSRVWIWLNDKLTVDGQILDNYYLRPAKGELQQPIRPKGPIELQTHGSEIRFRNIYVREIGTDEANETLEKRIGDEGYKSQFNGKDFTGWGGPIDQYEVKDGAIVCKPHKGGTIHTNEEFGDFEVKVEFKLPPAGNNGLAIRYPGATVPITSATVAGTVVTVQATNNFTAGQPVIIAGMTPASYNGTFKIVDVTPTTFTYWVKSKEDLGKFASATATGTGDTAYIGMCELQILDDPASVYAKLDPRQYCCSIYGVVPAKTGYLRQQGEWNFEHAIIKGHTIKVELNGYVVINADVSTVTEFMGKHGHPGLMRTSGSFGFAGHSDPVEFRNIQIKKLDAK